MVRSRAQFAEQAASAQRRWRSVHPFRPRLTKRRRGFMMALFFLFAGSIAGYAYVTDADRVKAIAEQYLTQILGGPVEVGSAKLSIFEGLQLDRITVRVDDSRGDDAIVFTAASFKIDYRAGSMLGGKLEASHILAIKPHVRLTQDTRTGQWNYQRMIHGGGDATSKPSDQQAPEVLPEIILRDAQVENGEMRDGRYYSLGTIAAEGRLFPGPEQGRYAFTLQSRNTSITDRLGPELSGWVVPRTGQIRLTLKDFEFGREIHSMLPSQVRQWWEQHEFAGVLNIPEIMYTPAHAAGAKGTFRVRMEVDGVTLLVHPAEWRSREENAAIESIRGALELPQLLPGSRRLKFLYRFTDNTPLRLGDVKASFVFTERGIDIQNLRGTVASSVASEANHFEISGHYDDYTPDAAAQISIASSSQKNFTIPHEPTYMKAMPPAVQEMYNRFKPEGHAKLKFEVMRPTPGARLSVTGSVEIIDGSFMFDRFPYPVTHASGSIEIKRDNASGEDRIEITGLRGRGLAGGPNENRYVTISGKVAPLTAEVGVDIRIEAKDVVSEPALIAAMPKETREALKLFDAPGKGEYPKFGGDFVCRVYLPRGIGTEFDVQTDMDIKHASGRLVAFPYPMDGVTTKLKIREGYLDIEGARMKRGDASLVVDGRVAWGQTEGKPEGSEPLMRPDLKVNARNVPIDKDLIAALPEGKRKWIETVGLGGTIDLDGRILVDERGEVGLDLDVALRNGTMWPTEGTFAVSNLSGKAKLTPTKLILSEVKAKRGTSDVTAHGTVDWTDDRNPTLNVMGNASDLVLDTALYKLLPSTAKAGWDQVKPEGTVDAEVTYIGGAGPSETAKKEALADVRTEVAVAPPPPPTTAPAPAELKLVIRPRKLAVTPAVFPLRLDDLKGVATVTSEKVTLEEITGHHGDATMSISGTGSLGDRATWELKVHGDKVKPDSQFIKAMPAAISKLLDSVQTTGTLELDFPKLIYRAPPPPATADGATPEGDIDFEARVTMQDVGAKLAVPLTDINGVIDVSGSYRAGSLTELSGGFDITTMKLAGRSSRGFKGKLQTLPEIPLRLSTDFQGELADGTFAGQIGMTFPDEGLSRFELGLVLRNGDIKELAGESEQDVSGRMTASLSLEGAWSDPASRRGRGDVLLSGKKMYRIPVVLGLLEMANLALPLSSPFKEGSARYSVQGSTVVLEQMEMRSDSMTMNGSGLLNFDTKKVKMNFTTDNPNWPKVPLLHELLQGARHELFQIRVNGSIQDPKVSAGMFNTFTTTVDEVMNPKGR